MPNKMNHAEVAERLEFIREDGEVGNAITLTPLGLNTLSDAAADERRIANGELVEVVHGRWTKETVIKRDSDGSTHVPTYTCSNCQHEEEYTHTRYCSSCAASMDGKDDSHA